MDAKNMKTALTIAGSDSSGGAGIQADIKTMITNGVYAMSAITALTAQNTTGVSGIFDVTPEFLAAQLDAVFTDIFPDAVKIGMVSSPALIEVISERLRFYQAKHIVVDPVLVATSGSALASGGVPDLMKKLLFPLAEVITPNIPEGEVLSGIKIQSESDMERAAKEIGDSCGCAVLLKGGHSINDANDLLYHNGTGCTLSSAIASGLAKGLSLPDAISAAKEYISGALASMMDLGHGSGPLNHAYRI